MSFTLVVKAEDSDKIEGYVWQYAPAFKVINIQQSAAEPTEFIVNGVTTNDKELYTWLHTHNESPFPFSTLLWFQEHVIRIK